MAAALTVSEILACFGQSLRSRLPVNFHTIGNALAHFAMAWVAV